MVMISVKINFFILQSHIKFWKYKNIHLFNQKFLTRTFLTEQDLENSGLGEFSLDVCDQLIFFENDISAVEIFFGPIKQGVIVLIS